MDRYIIKASGKMPEIIAALQTLRATFGKGSTLADVMRQQSEKIINDQINEIKKGW